MNFPEEKSHFENSENDENKSENNNSERSLENMSKSNFVKIFEKISVKNSEFLLNSFVIKLHSIEDQNSVLISKIESKLLNSIASLKNPQQILFLILSLYGQKLSDNQIYRIEQIIINSGVSTETIFDFLTKSENHKTVLRILESDSSQIDRFVRQIPETSNQTAIKNIKEILPCLPASHFLNYKQFSFLLSHENYLIRSAWIEILEALVELNKEKNSLDQISSITAEITDNLNDASFYVRAKTISSIGNLFSRGNILKNERNSIIRLVSERIDDKTILVRKKAIGLMVQIVSNHQFKSKKRLEIDDFGDHECLEENKQFETDFKEFVILMGEILSKIVSLLSYTLKSDLVEICQFIENAYVYGLEGSKQAVNSVLGIVFKTERDVVINMFKAIIRRKGNILYEFIGDKAFERIIKSLEVDENVLYRQFFRGEKIYESIYILRYLERGISEENGKSILDHSTALLFSSSDEENLEQNLEIYNNILSILMGMKRLECENEIFKIITNNIVKMKFYESTVLKKTIELMYKISLEPEKNVRVLIRNFCIVESFIKIVDSVGWIGFYQFLLCERLEGTFKKIPIETLKNARLSIDKPEIDDKTEETMRRKRLSLEGGMVQKTSPKISLNIEDIEKAIKDKDEDEIFEFFYFVREDELLFSDSALLGQFVPLVTEALSNENENIRIVAYQTICRLMFISTRFFLKHKDKFIESLYDKNSVIRNNSVIALHDFLIFYNSHLSQDILFEKLLDEESKKNAVLTIFSLLQKNVVRIKNNSVQLITHLEDESIGEIVKTLVRHFRKNVNIIGIMFIEVYQSDLPDSSVLFLSKFISTEMQEPLFSRCLKIEKPIERLKIVYSEFSLSDKFINENKYNTKMKELRGETKGE